MKTTTLTIGCDGKADAAIRQALAQHHPGAQIIEKKSIGGEASGWIILFTGSLQSAAALVFYLKTKAPAFVARQAALDGKPFEAPVAASDEEAMLAFLERIENGRS